MTFLKDRNWSFPICDMDKKVYEFFPSMLAEKFQLALGDVKREWSFLSIIWERLQNEYQEFSECRKVFQNLGKMKLTHQEISKFTRKFMLSFELIHLDTEDFFIHAEIMLDRVTFLITFFEKKIVKQGYQPRTESFKAFRKWFRDQKNSPLIFDIELKNYLLNNTDWFKKLEETRDDLIVHRKKSIHIDVMTEKGRAGKAKARFDNARNVVDWSYIKEMPDLNFLMDGISGFFHFFDKHLSQMLRVSYLF